MSIIQWFQNQLKTIKSYYKPYVVKLMSEYSNEAIESVKAF
jgi:hypothetical protein